MGICIKCGMFPETNFNLIMCKSCAKTKEDISVEFMQTLSYKEIKKDLLEGRIKFTQAVQELVKTFEIPANVASFCLELALKFDAKPLQMPPANLTANPPWYSYGTIIGADVKNNTITIKFKDPDWDHFPMMAELKVEPA